jgi:prepilin-type N-terminal cleavage/methylation domain-containing protein/prepilin-type processing-associated H-X9-DG protein
MRSRRAGFTLVEWLVVITIIGILVALLMPAVESVREAGRRTVCANNVKQLAMACQTHESKNGFFPTGGWGWTYAGDPNLGFTKLQPGGWHFNLLPYIGQETLYNLGRVTPYTGTQDQVGGQTTAKTPVAEFICPSRHHVQAFTRHHPTNYYNIADPQSLTPPVIGRSDYGANSGDGDTNVNPSQAPGAGGIWPAGTSGSDQATPRSTGGPGCTGVIYRGSMCSAAMIKDGLSCTYLLGERYLDPDAYYTYSECDNDQGWDQVYDYDTDRWTTNPPVRDRAGYVDNGGCSTIFGSAHPTGFNMAFCDGSVHSVPFTIDPVMHQQLGNRCDGGPGNVSSVLGAGN